MASNAKSTKEQARGRIFQVTGKIICKEAECQSEELELAVYLFDTVGHFVGEGAIDAKGRYSVNVKISRPMDLELFVGPPGQAKEIRNSQTFSARLAAADWKETGGIYALTFDHYVSISIWKLWLPKRICISGRIKKIFEENGESRDCPVPFVKVEVFDVDRLACFWPYFVKKPWLVLDRPVIRLPELLREPTPGPIDPGPYLRKNLKPGSLVNAVTINPQPESPVAECLSCSGDAALARLSPQPEPPDLAIKNVAGAVGEIAAQDATLVSRLANLTVTSKVAPWLIKPLCFYTQHLVKETVTDCNGMFKACFNWWPLKFRMGRLRYDSLPDIIIKVTQVINGVENVIYMDPYTSIRWNSGSTYIELNLDNEEIVCGNGYCYKPPAGSPVFFTRIGDDEVDRINQTTGLYNDTALSNVAYGHSLLVSGQFGDMLTQSDPVAGGTYYYYRLSYAKKGSGHFKYLNTALYDIRVEKGSLKKMNYKLGPFDVGNEESLYEVRNFAEYYWYNPEWIGTFHSHLAEEDTDDYVLRLEMFDKNGVVVKSSTGTVDYRNGALVDGDGALMPMTDHCDLVITLDNKPPVANLTIPAVKNECGVVPWADVTGGSSHLELKINALQENGRLRRWILYSTKGVGTEVVLTSSAIPAAGLGGEVNVNYLADDLLTGLTSTCAFAFRLWVEPHIRNGRSFIYRRQDIDAVAIEKCGS